MGLLDGMAKKVKDVGGALGRLTAGVTLVALLMGGGDALAQSTNLSQEDDDQPTNLPANFEDRDQAIAEDPNTIDFLQETRSNKRSLALRPENQNTTKTAKKPVNNDSTHREKNFDVGFDIRFGLDLLSGFKFGNFGGNADAAQISRYMNMGVGVPFTFRSGQNRYLQFQAGPFGRVGTITPNTELQEVIRDDVLNAGQFGVELSISGSTGLPFASIGVEAGQLYLDQLGNQRYGDVEVKLGVEHTNGDGSLQIAFTASATAYVQSQLNDFRVERQRILIGPFPVAEIPAGGVPNPDPESVLPGKQVGQADIGIYAEYRNNSFTIKKIGLGITGNVQANAANNPPGQRSRSGKDLGSVYLNIGF